MYRMQQHKNFISSCVCGKKDGVERDLLQVRGKKVLKLIYVESLAS